MVGNMIDLSFSMLDLEYFLIILVRTSAFIFSAPFFSTIQDPKVTRIGLAVCISYLLYFTLGPRAALEYNSILGFSAIVLKETLTGLLIGVSTNICTHILGFAGRIVDMEIGLSMVSQMDPTTNQNTTFTGLIYQYAFMLIMIATGMHRFLLKAFVETYEVIPVNGAIIHGQKLLVAIITFLSDFILIGFQIALPIFIAITLLNAILGILAKVAPQLNMFTVGIQIKILVGLGMLFITTSMLPSIADTIFTEMRKIMVLFVEGMM